MGDEFDTDFEPYYDYYNDNLEDDVCYDSSVIDRILEKELDIEKELMYNDDEEFTKAILEVARKG